jgi:hypothetical protein
MDRSRTNVVETRYDVQLVSAVPKPQRVAGPSPSSPIDRGERRWG